MKKAQARVNELYQAKLRSLKASTKGGEQTSDPAVKTVAVRQINVEPDDQVLQNNGSEPVLLDQQHYRKPIMQPTQVQNLFMMPPTKMNNKQPKKSNKHTAS